MCLAVPGRIVEITSEESWSRQGKVDFGGLTKDINLSMVPEATLGAYVLVHVGVAIETIDEEEAGRIFEALAELGELEREFDPDGEARTG